MTGVPWFFGLLALILLADWLVAVATPRNPDGSIRARLPAAERDSAADARANDVSWRG